jgi:hypothetical protein
MRISMNRALFLLLVLVLGPGAAAARAEVVTTLSSQVGQVGVPLQLQYQFVNTPDPQDMPRSLMVDGLDIRLTGTSRRVEMINFRTSSTMIYAYTVIPDRPGNFTIPGFAVQAGGQQIRTDSIDLQVAGGGVSPPAAPGGRQMAPGAPPRRPATPGAQPRRDQAGQPAEFYGELVMGAKSAYVGEVVPVELRYYFRADIQFDNLQRPTFAGDGFTAAPLSEPEQTEQMLDNVPYNVVTFRSAITPVKTGEITIPPAVMDGQMMVRGGPAGMDPFFDQFFQNMPMPGFGRAEPVQAKTSERTLSVQPLPKEGRPESFGGAIGQFTLEATASPRTAGPGEPVVLRLAVEGRGNFDAIAPPVLTGEDGWRTYAPKETFTADDAIGYGGQKTFEINMVARRDRTATPGAEFSYFDPRKKEYVTLTAEPVDVKAAGGGGGTDPAPAVADGTPSAPATAPAGPAAAPAVDIAAPAAALSPRTSAFRPLVLDPSFRAWHLAALVAVVLSIPFLIWLGRRARKSERTAALEAAIRSAKARWQTASDRAEFYGAAADFLQAHLALLDGRPAALVEPAEALDRRVEDLLERRGLQSVLARRDELKYGGGGGGAMDPVERRQVVEMLEKFASKHA